jgi:hypothetical protein
VGKRCKHFYARYLFPLTGPLQADGRIIIITIIIIGVVM